jgi:hypothetical protein
MGIDLKGLRTDVKSHKAARGPIALHEKNLTQSQTFIDQANRPGY